MPEEAGPASNTAEYAYDHWAASQLALGKSALFVMLSMGLFETDGGCALDPYYDLGSPLFDRVSIQLSQLHPSPARANGYHPKDEQPEDSRRIAAGSFPAR